MNFDWIRSLISFCRTSCKSVLTTSASNLWPNVYLCCSPSSDVAKWVFTWNELNEPHVFPIRLSTILAWQHLSRPCRAHTYTRSVTSQNRSNKTKLLNNCAEQKKSSSSSSLLCVSSFMILFVMFTCFSIFPPIFLSAFICFIQFLWEGHTEHCEWSESWARAKAHYVTLDLISFSIPTTQNNEEKRSKKKMRWWWFFRPKQQPTRVFQSCKLFSEVFMSSCSRQRIARMPPRVHEQNG